MFGRVSHKITGEKIEFRDAQNALNEFTHEIQQKTIEPMRLSDRWANFRVTNINKKAMLSQGNRAMPL